MNYEDQNMTTKVINRGLVNTLKKYWNEIKKC